MNKKMIYEVVPVTDKRDYYEKNNPFDEDMFNERVCCLHCDNEFTFNEFKVIRDNTTNEEYIVCKHYPECNGTIIDFMPIDYKTDTKQQQSEIEIIITDTKRLKENAEFVLAKFADTFEISKVSPFKEIIGDEEGIGNGYEFSFEIVTYDVPDKTPNNNGIPFTVFVTDDGYVDVDGRNTCIEFSIEDFKNPHFSDNFFEEFLL
jgi:hypothetical protein